MSRVLRNKRSFTRRKRLVRSLQLLLGLLLMLPLLISMPFGPWPEGTVLKVYDEHSGQHESIAQAVRGWNMSQNQVRFVFTKDQQQADVLVRSLKTARELRAWCSPLKIAALTPNSPTMSACTDWQGYKPIRKIRLGILQKTNGYHVAPAIVAHELGHIMGLSHDEDQCSVMNAVYSGNHCPGLQKPAEKWVACTGDEPCVNKPVFANMCGPMRDDLKRIVSIYGQNTVVKDNQWCWPVGIKPAFRFRR